MKKFISILKLNSFNEEKEIVISPEDIKWLREKHQGERPVFDTYTGEKTGTEPYPVAYEVKLTSGETFLVYKPSADILKKELLG